MRDRIVEIYGLPATASKDELIAAIKAEQCPFLGRRCLKIRKSTPEQTIGSCTAGHGAMAVLICPHRLIQNRQIFLDSIHLLTLHVPGNELHVVPEISIPGGSVDYVLASVKGGKVEDFVGIELQTLDSTGTIWPARVALTEKLGMADATNAGDSKAAFGMNWKMTAKTILMQLHHKIGTFEPLGKHLVLVVQDHLSGYMKRNFDFSQFREPRLGDSMHLHTYALNTDVKPYKLVMMERLSTDAAGISQSLGIQGSSKVELTAILRSIEHRLHLGIQLRLG